MKESVEKLTVFGFGGVGYGICELLWRGYTHFSMFLLGGVCFLVIFEAEKRFCVLSVPLRCFFYGLFITSMELVCGCVVNIVLRLGVWDYSMLPFNFYGQVCLQFSLLWMLLSLPVLFVCSYFRKQIG